VRNEEECVCSVCLFRYNIFIGFRIIKEMPGLVGSGTPYIILLSPSEISGFFLRIREILIQFVVCSQNVLVEVNLRFSQS